jgi:hypothetical protein
MTGGLKPIYQQISLKRSQLLCKESNERCIHCYKLTYIEEGKRNSTGPYRDICRESRVIATEKWNKLQKYKTSCGSGKVLVF